MNREEAVKRSEEALDQLAQALEQGKSDTLVKYLETLSRFHHYSFGNTLLIAIQRPDATHVAGYQRWKQLGRFVKQGEHGIAILAPLVYKRTAEVVDDQAEPENHEVKVLRGFKIVYVFDVSQTEGKELPQFAGISGEPGEQLRRLEALITESGIELRYEVIPGGALGCSSLGTIRIRPDLTSAETFTVLVHELAHERLHDKARRQEVTKTVRETEAEAVAFVVTNALGLETSTRSSDYIQLYAGNKEVLLESLDLIQSTATWILTNLETLEQRKEVSHDGPALACHVG
jgi:antirestriction protein ArdC